MIEQITYLLFLRRLDDMHTVEERKAQRLGKPIERRIYPQGSDERGRGYTNRRTSTSARKDLRPCFRAFRWIGCSSFWKRFKKRAAA